MMRSFLFAALLCGIPLFSAGAALAQPPTSGASRSGSHEPINWEDMIPKDWDPIRLLGGKDLSRLSDRDPKVERLLDEMRKIWDNAPPVLALEGRMIKLPGYVVPLETERGRLREFLLVPYFGGCIHSPPPPANQIVHVVLAQAASGIRSMDAVWVRGTLKIQRGNSYMGASTYRLAAVGVEPYVRTRK